MLGAGLAAAQAGHLAAYELRFGGAAQQLQSAGAHAYFPTLARTGLGLAAAAALAAMLIVGLARVATGRRVAERAPSFWRLLSVLYTVQLACFVGQETAEALFGGAQASSAPLLLLWGAVGQLPMALLVTVALRWLMARFGPALEALRPSASPRSVDHLIELWARTFAASALLSVPVLQTSYRRGPPSF